MAQMFDKAFSEVQFDTEGDYMISARAFNQEKARDEFERYVGDRFILDDVKKSWVRWGFFFDDFGVFRNGWVSCKETSHGAQPIWTACVSDIHQRERALIALAEADAKELVN